MKQMVGQIVSYFTADWAAPLEPGLSKLMVPPLVMGTKEKNTLVRTNSELALISLLRLRSGDSYLQVR